VGGVEVGGVSPGGVEYLSPIGSGTSFAMDSSKTSSWGERDFCVVRTMYIRRVRRGVFVSAMEMGFDVKSTGLLAGPRYPKIIINLRPLNSTDQCASSPESAAAI
jgi:hypothetical protein